MNLSPDEVKLVVEWDRLRSAFIAAKRKRGSPEYLKAKKAMSEFRTKWRTIRDAFTEPGPGEARPAPIEATTSVHDKRKG